MTEFLNNLYNNDNFVLYLSIAIGVLVVLFIIVYFWGRNDQKQEGTKKIKLNSLKGFKEEKKELTDDKKVEVENPLIKEDETEILPVINEENKQPNEVTTTVFEPIKEEKESIVEKAPDSISVEPEIQITVPEEPSGVSEYNNPRMEQIDHELEKELTDLAKIKDEFNKIDIDNMPKKAEKPSISDQEYFSSVYLNNENNHNKALEDDMDLPTLKSDSQNN